MTVVILSLQSITDMVNHNHTGRLAVKLHSTDGRFWFTARLSPLLLFMATSVSCGVDTITAKKAYNHLVYNPKQIPRNYRRRSIEPKLAFTCFLRCQWTSSLSKPVKMTNNMKLKNVNNPRKWSKTQESPPSHMKRVLFMEWLFCHAELCCCCCWATLKNLFMFIWFCFASELVLLRKALGNCFYSYRKKDLYPKPKYQNILFCIYLMHTLEK